MIQPLLGLSEKLRRRMDITRRGLVFGLSATALEHSRFTLVSIGAPQEKTDAEKFVDVRGARLWCRDTGSGIPVVFLHSATGQVEFWQYQFAPFMQQGFRCVAYDRRGFGRTTLEPGSPPGTGADDLEALRARLGFERFHLVSTAAGGIVGFDYALAFPDRLLSLVVSNSVGGVQDSSYAALRSRITPSWFINLPVEFRELGPSYRASNPEGTARWLELGRLNEAAQKPNTPQTLKNSLTFAALETVKTPTLLMTGDADLYAPPSVLRLFAAHMKSAQAHLFTEAGHNTYWEQPGQFNSVITAFLSKY